MPPTIPHRRLFAPIAAEMASALGLFVLAAWWLGHWDLATFGTNLIPMAPATAVAISLGGGALAWRLHRPEGRAAELSLLAAASLVALIGVLELTRWAIGAADPWDLPLVRLPARPEGMIVGRMAPFTATALELLALSLGSILRLGRFSAIRTVGIVAAGVGSIFVSIIILEYAAGAHLGYGNAEVPMALPTAIALLALYLAVLRTAYDRRTQGRTEGDVKVTRPGWIFSLGVNEITAGILVLIALTGIYFLRSQQGEARNQTFRELANITALKAQGLGQWRNERRDDARFLQRTPAIRADIASFLANPADAAARTRVLGWLDSMRNRRIPYVSLRLYDTAGQLLLATPATAGSAAIAADPGFVAALASPEVVLGEIMPGLPLRMEMFAAIPPVAGNPSTPVAIVALEIDPTVHLSPFLLRWPEVTIPGELMLAYREGNQVAYLDSNAGTPEPPSLLRRPLTEAALPVAMAGRGEFGDHEGIDNHGVAVFASIRPVRDSTWILVATIDQTEAYAEQNRETWIDGTLVGFLLLAARLAGAALARQRAAAAEEQRAALAERLGLITQYANDALFTFDEQMRIVDANERAFSTYGYTIKELRKLTARDLRPPDTAPSTGTDFAAVFQSNGRVFETIHRRKDGSTFPVEVNARPVDLEGRRHVLSIVLDISERKKAEHELQQRVQLHKALLGLPEAAETLDEKAFMQRGQELTEDATGSVISFIHFVNEDEVTIELVTWSRRTLEKYCRARFDSHYPVKQAGIWADALRERRSVVFNDYPSYPQKHGLPEGHSHLQRLISVPIIENGKVVMLTGVGNKSTDYTEQDLEAVQLLGASIWRLVQRTRTESKLRRLSSIVEQAPLAVVITDTKGAIEYVNPAFTKASGYTSAEALGQNPRILKSGETPAEVYREMWQALARGETWNGTLHNRKKTGETYIENVVIAPVVDGGGRVTSYVALKEDVTTHLQTVALLAKEREVTEMKTRFISVTSHEFRTPMAAAMGSAELLANHLERLTPAKRAELLNRITIALHRMAAMLDEILLLNRMDSKRVAVHPVALDFHRLVQNSLEEARLADPDAHRFEFAVAGDPAGFVTDASLMQHILSNLLSNAVRYSPAGSPITVRLEVGAAGARLEVEDHGIGIPPADIARLFQPFERGSNVGAIKGTGLGLSIVKRMIELLGGTVEIETPAGGGSRFVIRHPRLPTATSEA